MPDMKFFPVIFLIVVASSCSISYSNGSDFVKESNEGKNNNVVIRRNIDLKGQSLSLSRGVTLDFQGGSISNGNITFDATAIVGHPRFRNCTYKGTIRIDRIDDQDFASNDDTGTLFFLLTNAIENGSKCFINRDYSIKMNAVGSALIVCQGVDSGADISFQGHTVTNTSTFPTPRLKQVFAFRNVKNVTIRDCVFHDTEDHNTHKFKKSSGCTFVHCFGDCEGINLLNCIQENGDCILRSGVYSHDVNNPENTPRKGLCNSTIKVKSVNVGYGLALYCGDNLDIDIDVMNPHRGFYCAGVSNSTIRYKGYNPFETKCHILIKDAVFRKAGRNRNEVLDMKGCHDLRIMADIDEIFAKEGVVIFQSYGSGRKEGADFSFRSERCQHYNIDVSARIHRGNDDGAFFICRFVSDSGALNEEDMIGCRISNLLIHDVKCNSRNTIPYMCDMESFIDAAIDVRDCDIVDPNFAIKHRYNYRVWGNAIGRIRVSNSPFGDVEVRNKNSGILEIVLEDSSDKHEPHYIKNDNVKGLVRITNSTF